MAERYRWPADEGDAGLRRRLDPVDLGLPDAVVSSARDIIEAVRTDGDAALVRFGAKFDGAELSEDTLRVEPETIAKSAARADADLKAALQTAVDRVRRFHAPQRNSGYTQGEVGGAELRWMLRPVSAAALYVPGGRAAYPSTVIMNAVPAQVAGVERLAVFTVPGAVEDNPAVAYALELLGLDEVYRVGGAQAIAAAAFGTARIRPVDVIVGPGNAYVAAAKREVQGRVGIDSVAGPSEVMILADDSANPAFVAADLIAQAEHDPLARCVLATTSAALADAVEAELARRIPAAPRREVVEVAWRDHGAIVVVDDVEQLIVLCNLMAPEHLQVILQDPPEVERLVAGAIFVGNHAPTALGDYVAGPNHVLPTGGTARFSGPLGVHVFMRPTTVVRGTAALTQQIAGAGARVADYEGLAGHAAALRLREEDAK